MSLGPMWASPPKVRADVIISSSPPCNLSPYVEINTGPESHPGLSTQGSLGEAARACRLLPSTRVGLGWEEVKEWVQGKGSCQE